MPSGRRACQGPAGSGRGRRYPRTATAEAEGTIGDRENIMHHVVQAHSAEGNDLNLR